MMRVFVKYKAMMRIETPRLHNPCRWLFRDRADEALNLRRAERHASPCRQHSQQALSQLCDELKLPRDP